MSNHDIKALLDKELFVKDLLRELDDFKGKPQTENKLAYEMAEAIHLRQKQQLGEMNSFGAGMRWLDDYITAIKNPVDHQLMEMNTNILQYFATELDYKTKASKEVEARIIGDPVVRQASLLNANQAALESFGNSLKYDKKGLVITNKNKQK